MIRPKPLVVGLALAVALVAVLWWRSTGEEPLVVTADFTDTTGLYVDNDVEYLGVPIGTVTAIEARGTTMRVTMAIDPDTELPQQANASILQSALVTDRYVEIGPAFTDGPLLADGDHIGVEQTRSPAGVDEITQSIDELILALDQTTPGDNDIGELLRSAADTMRGNGGLVQETLRNGQEALGIFNARGDDLRAVTADLATLVDAVADRDASIRSFSTALDETTAVVAEQRTGISGTLASLDELTSVVEKFVAKNAEVIGADLEGALRMAKQVRRHQASLTEAFDTMPTLAENLARAYDWKQQRLRVQFNLETGPFSPSFRAQFCDVLLSTLCEALFAPDGSGALDPLLDNLEDAIPGNLP